MLRILNKYSHGYAFVPVAIALLEGGVFDRLASGRQPLEVLAKGLGANAGELRIALDMMVAMCWLDISGSGYALGSAKAESELLRHGVMELYHISPDELLSLPENAPLLSQWMQTVESGWGCGDPLSIMLDGPVLLPLLLGLARGGRVQALIDGDVQHLPAVYAIRAFFLARRWGKLDDEGGFVLGPIGKFMTGRAMVCGVTGSYRPLLARMPEMLWGDPDAVLAVGDSGEGHVDRSLNVQSSGFQHDKYFADMNMIIRSLFEGPEAKRPVYVADTGCGDGSLLKRIYETVTDQLGPDAVLPSVIGIDLNEAALQEAAETLQDIEHVLLTADIGNPQAILEGFQQNGVDAPERVLHVRSFLDHNRVFRSPKNVEAAQSRTELPFCASGVASGGRFLDARVCFQSLVEYLATWVPILGDHGLLCLEVHAQSPAVKKRYIDLAEGLHFDALHAFSRQYLCEAECFLAALAEVGLFPEGGIRQYPRGMNYTRITLGRYVHKPYTIRFARPEDAEKLAELDGASAGNIDATRAAALLVDSPGSSFVILDGTSNVCGVFICTTQGYDAESETRHICVQLHFGQQGYDVPLWEHVATYYGLMDGVAIFDCVRPDCLVAHKSVGDSRIRFLGEEG